MKNEEDPYKYIAKIKYTGNKMWVTKMHFDIFIREEPEYKEGPRKFGKDLNPNNLRPLLIDTENLMLTSKL